MANLNVQWVKFYINPKRDIEEAIDQFMEDTGMRAGDQTPEYEIRSIVTADGPYVCPVDRIFPT